MIRAVLLASLVGALSLVLYVPAAFPPERLLFHLRAEYQAAAQIWGEEPSVRILSRALRYQDAAGGVAPRGSPAPGPQWSDTANETLAREMASTTNRLFDSSYFRSLDTLLLLAAFRLSALLEWLPALLVFAVASLLDGAVVRRLRGKELRQHDPEMFAIHVCLALLIACGTFVLLVAPLTLHPALVPCLPVLFAIPLGRAVASFHRSG